MQNTEMDAVKGYLAHEKERPPRTPQEDYIYGEGVAHPPGLNNWIHRQVETETETERETERDREGGQRG